MGYRPAKTLIAAAATNGGAGGSIEIRADGQVIAKTFSVNAGKQTLGLDGITFRAAG